MENTDVSENDTNALLIRDAKLNAVFDIVDDDDVAQELRDDSSLRDEAERGTPLPANNSILGDFSLFRDFFLAAFSDGYYKVRFDFIVLKNIYSLFLISTSFPLHASGDLLWIGGFVSRWVYFTATS